MTKEEAQNIVDQYQKALSVLVEGKEAAAATIADNLKVINSLTDESLALAKKYDMLLYFSPETDKLRFNPEDCWDSSNQCW